MVGRWLFTNRGWLPVPFVAMALGVRPSHWAAGLVLMLVGEAIRLWAVGHIGRISRTRADQVGRLVDVGPYARLRNPLYVGNIVIFAGFGVIQWPWVLLLVPLLAAYYSVIVRWEEETLRGAIGAPYLDYCQRVPRWWPAGAARAGEWSAREALRSERGTLLVIVIVLLTLVVRWYLPI